VVAAKVKGALGGMTSGYRFTVSKSLAIETAFLYSVCPCEQIWQISDMSSRVSSFFEVENRSIALELGLVWNPAFIKVENMSFSLGLRYAGSEWSTESQENPPAVSGLSAEDPRKLSADVRSLEPYVGINYFLTLRNAQSRSAENLTLISGLRFFLRYSHQVWSNTEIENEQWGGDHFTTEIDRTDKQQFLPGVSVEIAP